MNAVNRKRRELGLKCGISLKTFEIETCRTLVKNSIFKHKNSSGNRDGRHFRDPIFNSLSLGNFEKRWTYSRVLPFLTYHKYSIITVWKKGTKSEKMGTSRIKDGKKKKTKD